MLSPKFVLLFLVVVAYAQGRSCRGDNVDLCSIIKAINSLGVKKLQDILGTVVSTFVCSLGLTKICLPICSVVQSLMDIGIEVDIIKLIVIEVGMEPPQCGGIVNGIF